MTDKAPSKCTCPPEPECEGPGVPVQLPGKAHRRGCPVVQHIFDMMDRTAREFAEADACCGGILPAPGEIEARRAQREVADLRRRVERLEAEQKNGSEGAHDGE